MHSNYVHIPYLHRPKIQLDIDSEPAYLLGLQYSHANRDQFVSSFQNTLWMSYRKGGDVGWGCMIRVVQMVFAEVVKRHNPGSCVDDVIGLFK